MGGSDFDGYFVRPFHLSRAAHRISEHSSALTSLSSEQQSKPLPATAFGQLPESSLVSSALASSLSHVAGDLNSAAEQASNTASGLTRCCHDYRHADDSVAGWFHRLHDHCHSFHHRRGGSGR